MTAAGDKIAGAKMMQGIELIVVELPASGDERALHVMKMYNISQLTQVA